MLPYLVGLTGLTAVLVALTLLPAVLGMLKSWAFRGRLRDFALLPGDEQIHVQHEHDDVDQRREVAHAEQQVPRAKGLVEQQPQGAQRQRYGHTSVARRPPASARLAHPYSL